MTGLSIDDLNRETPMEAAALVLTPPGRFFVRSHFPPPHLDAAAHHLRLEGAVREPIEIALGELRSLPAAEAVVTFECAGNGRALLAPRPPGTPWRLGAFGTARFAGTPLGRLLRGARPSPDARWVAFFGADAGEVAPGRVEPFARALPIDVALADGPLLAWRMNGEPLSGEHGFPLRLVVPGRYGVDSVKWLTRIEFRTESFGGFFQAERYRYVAQDGVPDGAGVGAMRLRSLIGRPVAGDVVPVGQRRWIVGSAWSGSGDIVRVEISVDGGSRWSDAQLTPRALRHGPTLWRFPWTPSRTGSMELVARAHDASGAAQPFEAPWNALGYGNNAVHRVPVEVVG